MLPLASPLRRIGKVSDQSFRRKELFFAKSNFYITGISEWSLGLENNRSHTLRNIEIGRKISSEYLSDFANH